MDTRKNKEKTVGKYVNCQINYSSAQVAFFFPSRKAINKFRDEDITHLKDRSQGKQSSSISDLKKKRKKKKEKSHYSNTSSKTLHKKGSKIIKKEKKERKKSFSSKNGSFNY